MSFVNPQLPPAHRADTYYTPSIRLTPISSRRFDSHGCGSEGLNSSHQVAVLLVLGLKGRREKTTPTTEAGMLFKTNRQRIGISVEPDKLIKTNKIVDFAACIPHLIENRLVA